jgi:hypothetical protein
MKQINIKIFKDGAIEVNGHALPQVAPPISIPTFEDWNEAVDRRPVWEFEAELERTNLLRWARAVAANCGAVEVVDEPARYWFPILGADTVVAKQLKDISICTYPFCFLEIENANKFYNIVGGANLNKIRELFYGGSFCASQQSQASLEAIMAGLDARKDMEEFAKRWS